MSTDIKVVEDPKQKSENSRFIGFILFMVVVVIAVVVAAVLIMQNLITVTFNHGYDGIVSSVTVTKGDTVEAPELTVRDGYEFVGWTYQDEPFDFTSAVSSDMTIEAVWRRIILPTSLDISAETVSLYVGDNHNILVTVLPADATDKELVFSSDNTAVATVDENGVVHAVGTGEAVISIATKKPNLVVTLKVTVTNPIRDITLTTHYDNLHIVTDGDYSRKATFSWSTSILNPDPFSISMVAELDMDALGYHDASVVNALDLVVSVEQISGAYIVSALDCNSGILATSIDSPLPVKLYLVAHDILTGESCKSNSLTVYVEPKLIVTIPQYGGITVETSGEDTVITVPVGMISRTVLINASFPLSNACYGCDGTSEIFIDGYFDRGILLSVSESAITSATLTVTSLAGQKLVYTIKPVS